MSVVKKKQTYWRFRANCFPGSSVEAAFHISSSQFLEWNPVVSVDCESGFQAGYSYCVSINPNFTSNTTISTSFTTPTSSSTSAVGTYSIIGNETSAVLVPIPTATAWPPTPTQSGILSPCKNSDTLP
jgi:hypothetical protein